MIERSATRVLFVMALAFTTSVNAQLPPDVRDRLAERSVVAKGSFVYAKAAGKPMAVMAHGSVGFQHAAMAVYNAWCDRVPLIMFGGNGIDAERSGD